MASTRVGEEGWRRVGVGEGLGLGKGWGRVGVGLGWGLGRGWGGVGEGLGKGCLPILQKTPVENPVNVP